MDGEEGRVLTRWGTDRGVEGRIYSGVLGVSRLGGEMPCLRGENA